VAHDPLEDGIWLEAILPQQAATSHQWILWPSVHLCPLLDLPLWDGPCILRFVPYLNGTLLGGLQAVIVIDQLLLSIQIIIGIDCISIFIVETVIAVFV